MKDVNKDNFLFNNERQLHIKIIWSNIYRKKLHKYRYLGEVSLRPKAGMLAEIYYSRCKTAIQTTLNLIKKTRSHVAISFN